MKDNSFTGINISNLAWRSKANASSLDHRKQTPLTERESMSARRYETTTIGNSIDSNRQGNLAHSIHMLTMYYLLGVHNDYSNIRSKIDAVIK